MTSKIKSLFLVLVLALLFARPVAATIPTEQSAVTLQGNGVTTVFSFPFVADSAQDIVVTYTSPGGEPMILSDAVYAVSLNPATTGNLWGVGGFVTYPLSGTPIAVGSQLTIQRVLPLLQTTDISNQGNFYPQVVESGLDTLLMQIQQVSARGGAFRGVWQTNNVFNYGDIVQDGVNGSDSGNYYLCIVANVSTTWTSDLAAGDWQLIITSVFPTTPLPLAISNGGTGQTTAAAALTALGGIGLSSNNTFTGANSFTGGSIAVPTAGAGDSTTKAASTAFVNTTALTLATGTTAVTQSSSDSSTKVATDAFVQSVSRPLVYVGSTVGNAIPQASTYYMFLGSASTAGPVLVDPLQGTLGAGTNGGLFVQASAGLPSGQTAVFTLIDENTSSSTGITCTITGPSGQCQDTTHVYSLFAGHAVAMQVVTSATTGSNNYSFSLSETIP